MPVWYFLLLNLFCFKFILLQFAKQQSRDGARSQRRTACGSLFRSHSRAITRSSAAYWTWPPDSFQTSNCCCACAEVLSSCCRFKAGENIRCMFPFFFLKLTLSFFSFSKVAHFYNTIDQQMIPSQRPLMLESALNFERIIKRPKVGSKVCLSGVNYFIFLLH